MNAHLQRLHAALRAEEAAERAEHERLDRLDPDEQVAVGHAWPALTAAEASRQGSRLSVPVQAPRGVQLHEGIGPGDPIWFEQRGERLAGSVDWVEGRRACVLLEARSEEAVSPGAARICRRHDPTTAIRYRQALERADRHSSALKDALLEGRSAAPAEQVLPEEGANPSQQRALAHALSAPELALIWGPPGTGKTWVLARLLRRLVDRGEKPWALADSNAAVDHLALAALEQGLKVVRLGPTARIGAALAPVRLEALIERSLYGKALATLERELGRAWGQPSWGRLNREYNELYQRARAQVLQDAEVIATTLGTLARLGEELPPPTTAVVDEATQATEPAVWTVVPWASRLVLAGDPAQLGPVVKTQGPLEVSLLQRLVEAGGLAETSAVMLEEQHRMAEPLRRLVSPVYGPRYTEAPHLPPRPAIFEQHALWIDTAGAGGEERCALTCSLYEPLEVQLVALLVSELQSRGISPADIGVIAPYSAQVARLSAQPALSGVEVATVNAFQGREREVIVVSLVRSNRFRELGFVADERRLTVALTRARRQLLLVGDVATLTAHPRYQALHEMLAERQAVRSVWEDPYAGALTF